ncbi:MAG: hypothetical protein ACOZNI_27725 [Myxococcota bacterium]
MLIGPLLSLASAATVTELPPFLRGNVTIGYSYDHLGGALMERGDDEVEVGDRTVSNHLLHYGVEFGVGPGVAAFVDLPHYVASSVSYGSLSEMVYDPSTDSGTYEGSTPGEPGTYVTGSALAGAWIGARGTPFSETAFPKRKNRATWLLEAALRTGSGNSFWTMANGESRGAGPGGPAFRFHTAFSTTFNLSQPYVAWTYVGEGATTVDVYAQDGSLLQSGVEVDPANTHDVKAGVQVLAARNDANGSQLAFDLHLKANYATAQNVPSGFFLPQVLATTEGTIVQQSEQFEPGAGLAILWRPMDYMEIDLYGSAAWHLPQRIESPYPIYTGADTLRLAVGSNLTVRIR